MPMPMCPHAERLVALALLALAPYFGGGSMAWARRPRRIFEPTDLELEEPGSLELDLQLGVVHSREGVRVLLPDFEIGLGLHRRLELDVDGAIGFESSTGGYGIDHTSLDSLWLSAKVGLISDLIGRSLWALGVQLGPKIPVSADSRGAGAEAVMLVAHGRGRWHQVLNVGGFIDPAPDASTGYPKALEGGLDIAVDFGAGAVNAVTSELAGIYFFSGESPQITATLGLKRSIAPHLELSLAVLIGEIDGSLHYGLLVGVAPKIRIWR